MKWPLVWRWNHDAALEHAWACYADIKRIKDEEIARGAASTLRWEYNRHQYLDYELTRMGEEGWELVTAKIVPHNPAYMDCVFKRMESDD